MKRTQRNGNLEAALAAYAQSVKANDIVTNFFKDRLNHWPIYAAAAGSALALSASAMADIIHDPGQLTSLVAAPHGSNINFDGDAVEGLAGYGTAAAFLRYKKNATSLFGTESRAGTASLGIRNGKLILGPNGYVLPLAKGVPITANLLHVTGFPHTSPGRHLLVAGTYHTSNFFGIASKARGNFKDWTSHVSHGSTYAGFFLANGDPGWLKIQVVGVARHKGVGPTPDAILILDWAIATNGQTITAGQTEEGCGPDHVVVCSGDDGGTINGGTGGTGGSGGTSESGGTGGTGGSTTIPEPSSLSLSLLAMGSVAVLAWRKMRKERAHQNQ